MEFTGSVIREQGVTFAIVVVQSHVLQSRNTAAEVAEDFAPVFDYVPVVLMAQSHQGRPTYFGRPDIVKFLSNINLGRIPWKKYTIS